VLKCYSVISLHVDNISQGQKSCKARNIFLFLHFYIFFYFIFHSYFSCRALVRLCVFSVCERDRESVRVRVCWSVCTTAAQQKWRLNLKTCLSHTHTLARLLWKLPLRWTPPTLSSMDRNRDIESELCSMGKRSPWCEIDLMLHFWQINWNNCFE